jgi:hypothetical protein
LAVVRLLDRPSIGVAEGTFTATGAITDTGLAADAFMVVGHGALHITGP